MVATLSWPFLAIADDRGHDLPYALLQGPVETVGQADTLAALRRTHALIGGTGVAEFPQLRPAHDRTDYAGLCLGWCHCFRDPDQYLPPGVPRALISHSDFIDPALVAPAGICGGGQVRTDYDFVYVCLPGRGQALAKNLSLASACIRILTGQLSLRGLMVGRPPPADLADCSRLERVGELPWRDLMQVLGRSRFLFVPNVRDASPRLLAEALCMDTPVLVNGNILGGWKYVNAFTGAFFTGEEDLTAAVETCLGRAKRPRAWFCSHHGPFHAGARLAEFLRQVSPTDDGLDRVRFAMLTDRLPDTVRCALDKL